MASPVAAQALTARRPMTELDETQLRELVSQAGRILHHQGCMDYLGHCSVRLPGDRVLIKPKHSPRTRGLHSVAPGDLVVIDLDGELVDGSEAPPAERFIHTEIYRARSDVHAVVHTHQPLGTLMGVIRADLKPVLHVPSVLADGGRMGTWDCPLLVTDADMGREVAAALGDRRLCHLTGHGIVSVAADIRLATLAALSVEQLAGTNLTILGTGRSPRVITDAEQDRLAETLATVDGRWAYHLQLLEDPA